MNDNEIESVVEYWLRINGHITWRNAWAWTGKQYVDADIIGFKRNLVKIIECKNYFDYTVNKIKKDLNNHYNLLIKHLTSKGSNPYGDPFPKLENIYEPKDDIKIEKILVFAGPESVLRNQQKIDAFEKIQVKPILFETIIREVWDYLKENCNLPNKVGKNTGYIRFLITIKSLSNI